MGGKQGVTQVTTTAADGTKSVVTITKKMQGTTYGVRGVKMTPQGPMIRVQEMSPKALDSASGKVLAGRPSGTHHLVHIDDLPPGLAAGIDDAAMKQIDDMAKAVGGKVPAPVPAAPVPRPPAAPAGPSLTQRGRDAVRRGGEQLRGAAGRIPGGATGAGLAAVGAAGAVQAVAAENRLRFRIGISRWSIHYS